MKILRKGPPWSEELECPNCMSLLLVDQSDLRIHWEDDPSLTQETSWIFFECGECKYHNQVKRLDQEIISYIYSHKDK